MSTASIETDKDPPPDGVTPVEWKRLKYDREVEKKLEGKGFIISFFIKCFELLKFWRWTVMITIAWNVSSAVSYLTIFGGKWFLASWSTIVLPFVKNTWLAIKALSLAAFSAH